ncbi:hypothetical protein J6590_068222 [Homalodisca vitripennis]|nr:hypothetical protein J6590_068222 [Homalodisca vitripennis]
MPMVDFPLGTLDTGIGSQPSRAAVNQRYFPATPRHDVRSQGVLRQRPHRKIHHWKAPKLCTTGTMGYLPWLLGLLVWLTVTSAHDPYSTLPKLITERGNLIITPGLDRNITFRTYGTSYVNIDDHNLLHIAQTAKTAADQVVRFQQGLERNILGRLDSLNRLVSGRRGLVSKMTNLERMINSGNFSTGPGSPTPSQGLVPGPGRPPFAVRLNRLTVRIRRVEIQLRRLQNLLSIDECLSNPCRNGGTCQDMFNSFMCICPPNWQGTLCDEDVNECAEFAGTDLGCQNGATCVNKPGTYECLCPETFFGLRCTLRTNDCSMGNTAQLCGHGVCINQGGNGRGYTCICDQGWTTDLSFSCTVDVDECQAKQYPCSHDPHVQCINLPGSFHCGFCPPEELAKTEALFKKVTSYFAPSSSLAVISEPEYISVNMSTPNEVPPESESIVENINDNESEKRELTKLGNTTSTIHEFQDRRAGSIVVVRTSSSPEDIYNSIPHCLVGITRHTKSFFILSKWIKKLTPLAQKSS